MNTTLRRSAFPFAAVAVLLAAAGCAQLRPAPAAPPEAAPVAVPPTAPLPPAASPAPEPAAAAAEASARAAEQSLQAGLRAYDDGNYKIAEQKLGAALKTGLSAPKDRASAHKTLAFLYCTSDRMKACEQSFRAARGADPRFALSKAESGHPMWGPVYRRALGLN